MAQPPASHLSILQCAFSFDEKLYLLHDGGIAPPLVPLTDLTQFPERSDEDISFHRIRPNPVFPNSLHYCRNGVKDNRRISPNQSVAVSLTKRPPYMARGAPMDLSSADPCTARVEWMVVGNSCLHLPSANLAATAAIAVPEVFCGCYSSGKQWIAVATRYDQEPGGSLWRMNRRPGKATFHCKARYFGPDNDGQPHMGFVDRDSALVFITDNSVRLVSYQSPQIHPLRRLPLAAFARRGSIKRLVS